MRIPLGGRLGLDSLTRATTVTAYFVQKSFTLSVDLRGKQGGEALFNANFSADDLQRLRSSGAIGDDNLPTYVASVTYGRVMLFSLKAETSEAEIKGAIQGWRVGNLTAEQRNLLQNSEVRLVTLGGTEESALRAIRAGDISAYFSGTTPLTAMVPISYEVRSVKDNRIASVNRTDRYSLEQCTQSTTQDIRVTLLGIEASRDCDGGVLEGSGEFFYSLSVNGEAVVSRPRGDVVVIGDGGYHAINLSRTLRLTRQPGQSVRITGRIDEADDTLGGTDDIQVAAVNLTHTFSGSAWSPGLGTYVARYAPNGSCDVSFYYRLQEAPQ